MPDTVVARGGSRVRSTKSPWTSIGCAVEQLAQRPHPLAGALVAGRRLERFAGDVGRDDVDRQPPVGELVDRRQLAGELRQPHLTHPHGEQQVDACRCAWRSPRRTRWSRSPVRIPTGAARCRTRCGRRCLTMSAQCVPGTGERRIGHAEELVVVVAQCAEPRDLGTSGSLIELMHRPPSFHVCDKIFVGRCADILSQTRIAVEMLVGDVMGGGRLRRPG